MAEPATFFRTYDRGWNRTGWSRDRQYPGQAAMTTDFPVRCHCGADFTKFASRAAAQMRCANGHATVKRPIAELVAVNG